MSIENDAVFSGISSVFQSDFIALFLSLIHILGGDLQGVIDHLDYLKDLNRKVYIERALEIIRDEGTEAISIRRMAKRCV